MAVEKFAVILIVLSLYSGQSNSVSVLEERPVHYANNDNNGDAGPISSMELLASKYFQQQAVVIEQISQIMEKQEQLEKSFNERFVLLETVITMRLDKFEEAIIERTELLISSQERSTEAFHDTLKQYQSSIESNMQNLNDQIGENHGQLKQSVAEMFINLLKTNDKMSSMDRKLSLMSKQMAAVDHRPAINGQIFEESVADNAEVPAIGSDSKDNLWSVSTINARPNYRSCSEVPKGESGLHWLQPFEGEEPFLGYCEQDQYEGGWLVFQHRFNGSVDFYRGWDDYKAGFGQPNGEYWLGLEKLHRLTSARKYTLMVELESFPANVLTAQYDHFEIGSESEQYVLKELGDYSGSAGDSLTLHKGKGFTTKDRDNDEKSWNNCAIEYSGAWWYRKCHFSNLNGLYMNHYTPSAMCWYSNNGYRRIKMSRMMIREA